MKRRLKPFIHALLLVALLLTTALPVATQAATATPTPSANTVTAATAAPTIPYVQVKKQLAETMNKLDQLRKLLDRSQFDLDELSFQLDGNPDAIIAFVRDQIAFEQYPGLLRGAQGTLLSRAGNALDKSALLAHLLIDAGYEVRIAHGTLDDQQAHALLQQMFVAHPAALPISPDMAKVKTLLAALANQAGASQTELADAVELALNPPPVTTTTWYSTTQTDTAYLSGLLAAAGIKLDDPTVDTKLVEEAKDYFWVQYRLGPAKPWQAIHPGFGKGSAPTKLVVQETFADESKIPLALKQRFQMEALIERKVGDTLETQSLFPPLAADVAALVGTPHTFAIVPDGIAGVFDATDPLQSLKKSHLFFPALDGKLVKAGQFFDLLGNLIPPDVATSPLAPLVSGVSGALGSALDALDTVTATEQVSNSHFLLTAVYINYTITAPGQEPKTFQRTLVDRIGADNRAKAQYTLLHPDDNTQDLVALTAKSTFMLAPGTYPAAYTMERTLAHLLQLRPAFELTLKSSYQPLTQDDLQAAKLDQIDFTWFGHFNLYPILDAGANALATVNYRPEPSLVIQKQEQAGELVRARIDIVNNTRRTLTRQGDVINGAAKALLQTGVWETRTEGIVLPRELATQSNTIHTLNQATAEAIPIRLFKPEESDKIDQLKIPTSAKNYVRAELAAGNLVIMPERMPTGVTEFGWWRINPATGQALGIMDGGMGTSITEYFVLLNIGAGLCLVPAAMDSNGLSIRDLIICTGMIVGGLATLPATLTIGAGLGFAVVMAATGVWLNTSPILDRPMPGT